MMLLRDAWGTNVREYFTLLSAAFPQHILPPLEDETMTVSF